ncbi:MAG: hypothetical protein K2X39_03395 [Silvanigrellaceae bacterium]|nr:hypothetical protein [Silvanigrellaceae bacterium]
MKTSCIRQPQNNHYIQVSAWQVQFCRGNHCAAFILSHFIGWHDWKLNHDEYYHRVNNIAEFHGDGRPHDQNAYLFFSIEEISEGILGTYGKNTITSALQFLEELGVISAHKNPNPRYHFDKTKYFIFYPDVCNDWIDANCSLKKEALDEKPKLTTQVADSSDRLLLNDRIPKIKSPSPKIKLPSPKKGLAITDTTSKATNKIKAAAICIPENGEKGEEKPAAAFFAEPNAFFNKPHQKKGTAALHSLPPKDCVIGESLSEKQLERVEALVQTLKNNGFISNPTALADEICFCILSPKHFKACGQDFSHKLNTIRAVISRGEWQTPCEMLLEAKNEPNAELKFLEKELQATYAELAHFERLLKESKAPVRDSFEKIIANAEIKILRLEEEIENVSQQTFEMEGRTILFA